MSAGLLYGNLATNDAVLKRAVNGIAGLHAAQIFLLLLAVVVTTVVTQAFEFEAIRILEGYWTSATPMLLLRSVFTTVHSFRRWRLRWRRSRFLARAERQTRHRFGGDPAAAEVCRRLLRGEDLGGAAPAAVAWLEPDGWEPHAKPRTVRALEMIDLALERYPSATHKLMPTRLGNVLRAREELMESRCTGGLEGLIQREFHRLPTSMQAEHDQFRGRLDLYCSLTLLSLVSAALGAITLRDAGRSTIMLIIAINGAFAWLFYRGAVASAIGYGQVAGSVVDYLDALDASTSSPADRCADSERRHGRARQLLGRILTLCLGQTGTGAPTGAVSDLPQSGAAQT